MKSKSAKAVLISIIVSLVIVIAVSLVLLLWALPSGAIESMALSHFLTALTPVLGISLIMATSALWIKAGKKKPQPPFDEDVIKEPSSYDSPLYGDLDADDYVSPFNVKSMTPEDWDYIEEFEGLPEKQKKRILASMEKPIERPNINFDDLSENYPFTESFDFYNVPFDTYAFDKPETPKITPFVEKEPEALPELEEFPEVDFGEDRLFESPLAPKLRDMLFNPEYSTNKLEGDKVLIARNDDFKLKRPIYRLTAAEGAIDFVWHKDEKEREPQEKYIAPSILWKMIGEFLIKLKPVNVKKNTKTIAPSVQEIESEETIEKKKALATVEESIDAYALLSLPENVKENPEALEEKQETANTVSAVKYQSENSISDDATTEEAFSSLMSPASEVYTANNSRSYASENTSAENDEIIPSDKADEISPIEAVPTAKLDVTSGIYDISYHEEFDSESDAFVIKYDHSKKEEPIVSASTPEKSNQIQANASKEEEPTYTETLPENPLFSLDENEGEKGSDPYTIKYKHDTLPEMTSFEFDVEKPQVKKETSEGSNNEQAIVPFQKNEVALKEFDKIIPFDDNRDIQVKEKGEIANIQSSEVSPTLPPFSSYEFEVSAPTTPFPTTPSDKDDNRESDAILSDFADFNAINDDYRNDLLDSFNALKRDEEVPSYENAESDEEITADSEETEPKYIPNKLLGDNPTLIEAYDALMKCGVFTTFSFDVDMPATSPKVEIIAEKEEEIVLDFPTVKENSLVPEFDELFTPSDMYDKVISLKHRESYDALPLPEKMPLTRARSIVPFGWLEDKGEPLPKEEYIAPTDEQIAKGEFAAKLSPVDIIKHPITAAENAVNFAWNADTMERPEPEAYIAPNEEQIEKGEFIAKLAPSKAESIEFVKEDKENSLVPEFDELFTPSDMYDKVLSLKHRESYDALPLPEKMPLTRARSIVPFGWLEDKGEPLPEEEYIAPTDEQIAKGEFVAKLSPIDIIKHPITAAENAVNFAWNADTMERPEPEAYIAPNEEQIEKGEFIAKLAPSKASEEPSFAEDIYNDQQVEEVIEETIEDYSEAEDKENSLVPEFDELFTPSDMYDKVLSLKHRESYDALPLPEKMPLTRARSIVPFGWLEDKGEPLPEEEYIAPTDEQIAKGEFVAKLSPVDISKLPSVEDEEVPEIDETVEEIVLDDEDEDSLVAEPIEASPVEEKSESQDYEETPRQEETEQVEEVEQTPETFTQAFNDILEIEMSEARKFDYELTIARIISEKADDIARLDIEAMAFMEDTNKLCIIFPCQTKAEATELIRLIKDAVGDKNMKVRIAELRGRGITAAVFSLEIFR